MQLPPGSSPNPDPVRRSDVAALVVLVGLTLCGPLVLRAGNPSDAGRSGLPANYLPALEGPRERKAFQQERVPELTRFKPGYVVIGDSMAGTRIDHRRLSELTGRPVAPLLQAGSGPAFWYLALKNWVVAAGIHPRVVFIFFRDTNLTDVMYRLDPQFRWSVDLVAHEREPELNAVVLSRLGGRRLLVERAVEQVYQGERTRAWIEPAITAWPTRLMLPSRRLRSAFTDQMNARLGLEHLRRMEGADMAVEAAVAEDFDRDVDRSVLPLMLDEAARAGLRLCFVRVQRRPIGDRPPDQSAALQRYMRQLRAYVEQRGAILRDDTGDPALTIDMYEDGDHIASSARRRYTEILFDRLRPLFQ